MPNQPAYNVGDEVFLVASAEIGFVESYRVNNIIWNPQGEVWTYTIDIHPRGPAPLLTVGDRISHKAGKRLSFAENELTDFCTAANLVRTNLERRLAAIELEIASKCSTTT